MVVVIRHHGPRGGNTVADKRVDFGYNADGQFDAITRSNNLAGTQVVATGQYGYDLAGRLTSLAYTQGQTTLATHDWSFDAANRITQYINNVDGTVDYTNDDTGQLTGADFDSQSIADEAYSYDANGNRTNTGYVTGANNQVLCDGTYRYGYDAEGNRIVRYVNGDINPELSAGDTDITTYTWDYRDRLTKVSHYADYAGYTGDEPTWVVEYAYDAANRLVKRTLDPDGSGEAGVEQTVLVYDGTQAIMQFDKSGSGDVGAADLSHRFAWGAVVDQLMTEEQVHWDSGQQDFVSDEVLWALTDHLNTVRDVAVYDSQAGTTTVENHRVFSAFGRMVSESDPDYSTAFAFTGRYVDPVTGLQWNLNRWYDSTIGKWISEDPIAADDNLGRYCHNSPVIAVDPTGLVVYFSKKLSGELKKFLDDHLITGYNTPHDDPFKKDYCIWDGRTAFPPYSKLVTEIVATMIRSPRKFKIDLPHDAEVSRALFLKHIQARIRLVTAADTFHAAFPKSTKDVKANPQYWNVKDGKLILKPDASASIAIADAWQNPQLYTIACQGATNFVISKALGVGADLYPDMTSDNLNDWVPGDMGFIENTTFAGAFAQEGENIVYLGAQKGWWGHIPDSPDIRQLEGKGGWIEYVSGWGKPEVTSVRKYPRDGLKL